MDHRKNLSLQVLTIRVSQRVGNGASTYIYWILHTTYGCERPICNQATTAATTVFQRALSAANITECVLGHSFIGRVSPRCTSGLGSFLPCLHSRSGMVQCGTWRNWAPKCLPKRIKDLKGTVPASSRATAMPQPNFLIIIADDLGFTDLSAFGGEIHTPNLARLAAKGVRFSDFHTALACSPTRAMLLSGTDNHIAGLGQMHEFTKFHPGVFDDKPGYEGYLNDRVVSLSEILCDAGYYTFISGKWHLGLLPEYWPLKRGFEKAFTLLPGAGNHYKFIPKDEFGDGLKFLPWLYAENNRQVDAEKEIPDDFYLLTYFTTKGLEYLDHADRKGRPFFGALTYTAPHWPYQAPPEIVAKYKGKYNGGPEELRRARLAGAAKAGVIPPGTPHPLTTLRKRWLELLEAEKEVEARIMETYAAMVEVLDENIGRFLDRLEEKGELDNTMVLFMSDNGAEGMLMEALPLAIGRINLFVDKYYDNSFDNIGRPNSFVTYGDQWAQAATAPHSMYKMWTTEGAIVCPLVFSYPPLTGKSAGGVFPAFATVMDILPTVLELAGVEHPGNTYKGRSVATPRGASWVSYLDGKLPQVHLEDHVTGWELFGQQAVRKGSYKALYIPAPFGNNKWQLYDIRKDPGETKDLAENEPEKLEEMLEHWAIYVAETGLVEVRERMFGGDAGGNPQTVPFTVVEELLS